MRVSGQVEHGAGAHSGDAVVVYLEASSAGFGWLEQLKQDEVELEIWDGRLDPSIGVVSPGQRLRFRNHDRSHHELFSVAGENSFRTRVRGRDRSGFIELPRAALVRVFCELHPDEDNLILVSGASLHAVADDQNRFEFPSVRPGEYRAGAIGPHSQSEVRALRIEASGSTDLRLVLLPR